MFFYDEVRLCCKTTLDNVAGSLECLNFDHMFADKIYILRKNFIIASPKLHMKMIFWIFSIIAFCRFLTLNWDRASPLRPLEYIIELEKKCMSKCSNTLFSNSEYWLICKNLKASKIKAISPLHPYPRIGEAHDVLFFLRVQVKSSDMMSRIVICCLNLWRMQGHSYT